MFIVASIPHCLSSLFCVSAFIDFLLLFFILVIFFFFFGGGGGVGGGVVSHFIAGYPKAVLLFLG